MKTFVLSLFFVFGLCDRAFAQSSTSLGSMTKDMISYELLDSQSNTTLQLVELTEPQLWAMDFTDSSASQTSTEAGFSISFNKTK